jgi:hypothetical protein
MLLAIMVNYILLLLIHTADLKCVILVIRLLVHRISQHVHLASTPNRIVILVIAVINIDVLMIQQILAEVLCVRWPFQHVKLMKDYARIVILEIVAIDMNVFLLLQQIVLMTSLLVTLAIGMEYVSTINSVAAIMERMVIVFI